MVPQSGDSVRGWWPQCGKTREWSTTSPVPTHLTGHPTHLVQTRQPFHFPQNFLHLTALHSTRSNNSHSELFFHVSAFDSNFSQSPSSCLRLSKRQAFNQKLRENKHELANESMEKSMKKSFLASEFPVSVHHAHCGVCLLNFNVSHGGILPAWHWEIGKVATPFVTTFFRKASNESQNVDVIQAETLFTNFLVLHLVTEICA